MQEYYGYCLKGRLDSGVAAIIKKKDPLSLFRKVEKRFLLKNEKLSSRIYHPFVRDLIEIYHFYYCEALLNPHRPKKYETLLEKKLSRLIQDYRLTKKELKLEAIEKLLVRTLKKLGFYSLFGVVKPWRSLLIWENEVSKEYGVSLLGKKEQVQVVFLENFLELGWLHYATFGKYYVGGWAKKDTLYCVKQAYAVESEVFQVHYLAHEAQHFRDYREFPKLGQVDFEYRAKLTELSLTSKAKKFARRLALEATPNPDIPHSYSAHMILKGLGTEWERMSNSQLNRSAEVLFRQHTHMAKRNGSLLD